MYGLAFFCEYAITQTDKESIKNCFSDRFRKYIKNNKMATYKEVVGVLGENLASLLELAKRWLTEWAIEPKELLHLFQNIRKDDLMGLIAGTHEIKVKKQAQSAVPSSSDDEYFECVLITDYITVPDMGTVATYAKEKWGNKVGSVTASMPLTTGARKRIKIFNFKKSPSSQRCADFIKSQNAILPNVYGLAVVEMTVVSQLPRDKWILAFDNRDNLALSGFDDRRVPDMCLDSRGTVVRDANTWGGDWNVSAHCLVLLCD